MKVVIRADASEQIGSGHVMRCLTLAEMLRQKGAEIVFFSCVQPGDYCRVIEGRGFKVHRLAVTAKETGFDWQNDVEQCQKLLAQHPADWLIVDHYCLDARWESWLRPFVSKIMVVDDLADRSHDCNLLFDQNLSVDYLTRYRGLVPETATCLLGARYALLRDEFYRAAQSLQKRNRPLQRLLVFFGGSDYSNETSKALAALARLDRPELAVDLVLGSGNPNRELILATCIQLPQVTCHQQVENMAELMAAADLAIGAGGGTTWERLYLQLPSIVIATAENQVAVMEYLGQEGYIEYLGESREVTVEAIVTALASAIEQGLELKNYEFDNWRDILWQQLQDCPEH